MGEQGSGYPLQLSVLRRAARSQRKCHGFCRYLRLGHGTGLSSRRRPRRSSRSVRGVGYALTLRSACTSAVIWSPPQDVLVGQEVCVVDMWLNSVHEEDTEFENSSDKQLRLRPGSRTCYR